MFELFKAELLRFRAWALLLALAHLAGLGFLLRIVDPMQQPLSVHWAFGAGYALIGILLGLYQMGTYRKPNVWLNLLHRPLPPKRIAVALMSAAVAVLLAVIALPMFAAALWQDTMTARVVDLRHWLLPFAGLQIASIGYLIGAYAMLAERRYAASGLIFLLLLPMAQATGFGALALQAAILLWLSAMVFVSFKPDLETPPRAIASTAVVALPLQVGVFLLMLTSYYAIELIWIAEGSHPNNTPTSPRGGHNEVEKAEPRQRMLLALDGSSHPEAALFREQIALSEPIGIPSQLGRLPQRHELANVAPMEFDDGRGVRWVFSHDDMRFHGYRLGDRRAVGDFGVGERNAVFPAPALPVGALPGMVEGDALLLAGNRAYHYEAETGRAWPRIRLPKDEAMVGGGPVGESLGVISDRALYFFDTREAIEHRRVLRPRLRVPMPGDYRDLYTLDLIELVDGYLIAFAYTSSAHNEHGAAPRQHTLWVHEDGRIETVAVRPLVHDMPLFYRYRSFMTSPLLHALCDAAIRALAPPMPLERNTPLPVPRAIWIAAIALSALAFILGLWRSRSLRMSTAVRVAWLAACLAIGLPALIALWLLYRPSLQMRSPPERAPALAAATA